jgi:hypothetical protein
MRDHRTNWADEAARPQYSKEGGQHAAKASSITHWIPGQLQSEYQASFLYRKSTGGWLETKPVLHHPGIQECPDKLQQPLIFDFSRMPICRTYQPTQPFVTAGM